MRILVINSRFYYVGGPERYLFNLKELLESHGHEVIPFSLKNVDNVPTPYERYFPSALSDNQSTYFKDQNWNARSVVRTLQANFYSSEVEHTLEKLIRDTRPDCAIVLLFLRKLSPAVLDVLSRMKVPYAVRLSDFGLICSAGTFYRQNHICELCLKGSHVNSVLHRCVHNSIGASTIDWMARIYHGYRGFFDSVKTFLVPSEFLMNKMIEAGWDSKRFVHLPTFAHPVNGTSVAREPARVLYSGRLERVKGVHLLLEAVLSIRELYGLELSLVLAGNGDEEYIRSLLEFVEANRIQKFTYLGNVRKKEALYDEYRKAAVCVIPSLWYDNMPNSAIESMWCGTPIVAPNHGCFPEFVLDGRTGLLFEPNNVTSLSEALLRLVRNTDLRMSMETASIDFVRANHSPEVHLSRLEGALRNLVTIQGRQG